MQWIEKFRNRNKRLKEAHENNAKSYPKAEAFEVGGFGGGFGGGAVSTNFDESPIKSSNQSPGYSPVKAKPWKQKTWGRTGTTKHAKHTNRGD